MVDKLDINWGRLENLIDDPSISVILVEAFQDTMLYVKQVDAPDKFNLIEYIVFDDNKTVDDFLQNLATQLNQRFDEQHPTLNYKLDNGTYISATMPPVCPDGITLTITKQSQPKQVSLDEMVEAGSLSFAMAQLLKAYTVLGLNIFITGKQSAGKTTLLRALSDYIAPYERISLVSSSRNVWKPQHKFYVNFVLPDDDQRRKIYTASQVIENVLNYHFDRLLIDDLDDAGALLELLTIISGNIKGIGLTLPSDSVKSFISSLELLPSLSGHAMPYRTIRSYIHSTVDLIVCVDTSASGSHYISQIAQLDYDNNRIAIHDIFVAEAGKQATDIQFLPTKILPHYYESLAFAGMTLPQELFGLERPVVKASPKWRDAFNRLFRPAIFRAEKKSRKEIEGIVYQETPISAHADIKLKTSEFSATVTDNSISPEQLTALKKLLIPQMIALYEQENETALPTSKNDALLSLRDKLTELFDAVRAEQSFILSKNMRQSLFDEIVAEVLGFGPLDRLISDKGVTGIEVINPKTILYVQTGFYRQAELTFEDETHLETMLNRMLPSDERASNEHNTKEIFQFYRLPDSSVVRLARAPVVENTYASISKYSNSYLSIFDLIRFGTLTHEIAEFIRACTISGMNIIVCGGMGSGKTTLLNICSSFIPPDERIVTVEYLAQLQIQQEHVVTLEATDHAPISTLFKEAINLHPHRVITSDLRGGEAFDVIEIMNFEDISVMLTMVGNNPADALARLESMALRTETNIPVEMIRKRIASGVDFVIHQERLRDGTRKVVDISEVRGMKDGEIVLTPIFQFEAVGQENGKIIGRFRATREIPYHLFAIENRGIFLSPSTWGYPISDRRGRQDRKMQKEFAAKFAEVEAANRTDIEINPNNLTASS